MAPMLGVVGVVFLGLACVVFAENPEAVDQSVIKGKAGIVAFSVGLSAHVDHVPDVDVTIPYDVINLNLGGGFEPVSSQFFAPVAGIYQFSFCVLSQSGGGVLHVSLMVNGQLLSSIHGNDASYDQGCKIQLVQLAAADVLYVVIKEFSTKGVYDNIYKYSTFSGYLIHEII